MITLRHHPIFEDNQVLTSSQLNDLFSFLDQQDKLTRTTLIGIGIVCGLEVECLEAPVQVQISKGVGVTSQGYLIKISECTTSFSKPYSLPGSLDYPPFEDPITKEQDIEIFELLTEDEAATDGDAGITELTKEFLADKIVLLFLECFDQDMKSCLGKSCDELGINRILTLRKLLISEAEFQIVLERTNGGKTLPDALSGQWEKLLAPRVFFDRTNQINYLSYSLAYSKAIQGILSNLKIALDDTYIDWEVLLETEYGSNPFASAEVQAVYSQINDYLAGNSSNGIPLFGIQYLYDLIKDLLLAYNAFCASACECQVECCPDDSLFPKHLVLGFAVTGNGIYRNGFTASPAVAACGCHHGGILKTLHVRIVELIKRFDMKVLSLEVERETNLKITPSCEKKSRLEERTIPHYYDFPQGEDDKFKDQWFVDHCLETNGLSFAENTMDENIQDPISTPLHFDLDAFNFYRIEGFLGRDVKDVLSEIQKLRKNYQLPFDIGALHLGKETSLDFLPECLCTDLQAPYSIWRNKTRYFLISWLRLSRLMEKYFGARSRVVDAATSFQTQSKVKKDETNAFSNAAEANNAATNFASAVNLTKDDWQFSAAKVFEVRDEINTIDPSLSGNLSDSANDSAAAKFHALLKEYNNCLRELIDSMTVSIKDFSKEEWIKKYQCQLYTYIKGLKEAITLVDNRQSQFQLYIILLFACILYEIIAFLAIYPYISMGSVMNILEERIKMWEQMTHLNGALNTFPGLEHQAGVPKGGTFLLLYQAEPVDSKIGGEAGGIIDKLFEGNVDPGEIQKVLQDKVIGDFALPYKCCDPCGSLDNAAKELTPLALPRCAVARATVNGKYRTEGNGNLQYHTLKMRTIHHPYDLEVFEARIMPGGAQPKFGEVSFTEAQAPEMPDKKAQFLNYDLDIGKVSEATSGANEQFFLVDEFQYEYILRESGEVVGDSTISIFIPVIDVVQEGNVDVTGRVVAASKGDEVLVPVPGVRVQIRSTTQAAFTNSKGEFTINSVPPGDQSFQASASGFVTNKFDVKVETGMKPVEIKLTPISIFEDDFGIKTEILEKELGIKNNSVEANVLKNRISRKLTDHQKVIAKLAESETGKEVPLVQSTNEVVKEITSPVDVNTNRLNSLFVKQRDELNESIAIRNNPNREVETEALKILTMSYLDRVSVNQAAGASATTSKILNDTATIMNKAGGDKFKKQFKIWQENNVEVLSAKFSNSISTDFKL